MARMTAKMIADINNLREAFRVAAFGSRVDALEYGSVATPATGTVTPVGVVKYVTTPALGTAIATHAAVTLGAAATTVTTGFTQPDFARVVSVKGNASGNAGNVVVNGTDMADAVITETLALNAATEVIGTLAFKSITSVVLPIQTHVGTDTVSIGRGNIIGFPVAIPTTTRVLSKMFNNAVDSGTVTAATTVSGSTFAPAGTLDGSKEVSVIFVA